VVSCFGSLPQLFAACSFLLTCSYASTTISLLVRVSRLCWVLLPVRSFVPSAIGKLQLASVLQSPRPLLCAFSEFLVFRCCHLFLVHAWLGIALARQIPSLLLCLSHVLPPLPPIILPPPLPLPLLLPREIPFS
jgi:hypothetical protein